MRDTLVLTKTYSSKGSGGSRDEPDNILFLTMLSTEVTSVNNSNRTAPNMIQLCQRRLQMTSRLTDVRLTLTKSSSSNVESKTMKYPIVADTQVQYKIRARVNLVFYRSYGLSYLIYSQESPSHICHTIKLTPVLFQVSMCIMLRAIFSSVACVKKKVEGPFSGPSVLEQNFFRPTTKSSFLLWKDQNLVLPPEMVQILHTRK